MEYYALAVSIVQVTPCYQRTPNSHKIAIENQKYSFKIYQTVLTFRTNKDATIIKETLSDSVTVSFLTMFNFVAVYAIFGAESK